MYAVGESHILYFALEIHVDVSSKNNLLMPSNQYFFLELRFHKKVKRDMFKQLIQNFTV